MAGYSRIDHERLFEQSPTPHAVLSPDLTVIATNHAYREVAGAQAQSLIGQSIFDVCAVLGDHHDTKAAQSSLQRVLKHGRADVLIAGAHNGRTLLPTDNTLAEPPFPAIVHTPLCDIEGNVAQILLSAIPVPSASVIKNVPALPTIVDHRSRASGDDGRGIARSDADSVLQADEQRLRKLFEQAPGFMTVLRGPDHVFELANEAYQQLVGHRDILGKPVREALPELAGQGFYELLDQVYATGEPFIGRAMPIQFQPRPGAALETKHIDFIYQAIVDDDGVITGLFVQGHDVSEAHALAQEVSYQATHDMLTGLGNRRKLEEALRETVGDVVNGASRCSLLYLDLDQFKVVNDTCGHAAGDELLRRVAAVLRETLSGRGTLARLGGDEFVLLLRNYRLEEAGEWAERLRSRVAQIDFAWGHRRFNVSVSIGVTAFDDGSRSEAELLSTADSACFLAKEKGRNRVHVHHPDDTELTARLREMDWVSVLRQAMDEERLVLYAQRMVPLNDAVKPATRREVLVRLLDAEGELVPPMAFIPAAERYGLMPRVDRYVVRTTFRHFAEHDARSGQPGYYSINLSGATLNDDDFLTFIQAAAAEWSVPPAHFCFEITETVAISNLSLTAKMIAAIRELGFRFALDDFGSGMSSFSYLKHLPVDFLKIDGEFIRNILNDATDRAVVKAIADVARTMGIRTVAEFVDSNMVEDLLRDLGVDFAQGFGIHKPEPMR